MKGLIIAIIVMVAIGVGAYLTLSNQPAIDTANQNQDSMMENENVVNDDSMENDAMMDDKTMDDKDLMMDDDKDDSMMKDEETSMQKSGQYTDYNAALLANADQGDVVLFFHAQWCPYCRGLDTALNNSRSEIPSDLTILKVDYDNSSDLKKKYGVTYQHTLVQVDAAGNMVAKWNGSPDLADVIKHLN